MRAEEILGAYLALALMMAGAAYALSLPGCLTLILLFWLYPTA